MSEVKCCPGCGSPRYQRGQGAHLGSLSMDCTPADPGETVMTFWKDNKTGQEFSWPIGAVRDAFMTATTRGDWPLKLEQWPLERVLRDWLTHPDEFGSAWDDEDAFTELLGAVRAGVFPKVTKGTE